MWRYILAAAITAVIMFAIYGPRGSRGASGPATASTFQWSGLIEPANAVVVRSTSGRIRFEGSTNDSVSVRAVKRQGRRSRDIEVVAREVNGNLYVCPTVAGRGSCGPDGFSPGRRRGFLGFTRRTDMHVDFTVSVPVGVIADGRTNNGALSVRNVAGEVRARTVNGRLDLTNVYGPVTAQSTNGSIRVRIDSLPAQAGVSIRTTNGSVTAELPRALSADVELATTNGRINSGYTVALASEISSRRFRGRIGEGGRDISIRTTNGSITLRPVAGDADVEMNIDDVVAGAVRAAEAAASMAAAAAAAGITVTADSIMVNPAGTGVKVQVNRPRGTAPAPPEPPRQP